MQRCCSSRNVFQRIVLLASTLVAAPCLAGNWSQFRGDEGAGVGADLRNPRDGVPIKFSGRSTCPVWDIPRR